MSKKVTGLLLGQQPRFPTMQTGPMRYCPICHAFKQTYAGKFTVHTTPGGEICGNSDHAVIQQTAPLQTPLTGGSRDEPAA